MMTVLMRASEIAKRPVVTMTGEDVAQIKDIVYAAGGGEIGGFTLNGRGRFAGPLKTSLPWTAVAALGPAAVMIAAESDLVDHRQLVDDLGADGEGGHGDVLSSRVLTADGTDLGRVVDVIVEVTPGRTSRSSSSKADVVGYEIEPSDALGQDVKRVLIPLPDTITASSEHLIVPAATTDFVRHDLAGFGAAVEAFREQLAEQK